MKNDDETQLRCRDIDAVEYREDNKEIGSNFCKDRSMVKKNSKTKHANRKRRTREHVIEDLSIHHVQGLALRCGFVMQRINADYGYDLWLQTFNENGEIENNYAQLQVKASDNLNQFELIEKDVFSVPVENKDYEIWSEALLPVYLIIYDAQLCEAYWLDVQEHAAPRPDPASGKWLRLHVPRQQVLGVQTFRLMRERAQARRESLKGTT